MPTLFTRHYLGRVLGLPIYGLDSPSLGSAAGAKLVTSSDSTTLPSPAPSSMASLPADASTVAVLSAYQSALSKFPSLETLFQGSMVVPQVMALLWDEISNDSDFIAVVEDPSGRERLQEVVRREVGLRYGQWKRCSRSERGPQDAQTKMTGGNKMPWSSIEHFPVWIAEQVHCYLNAEPDEREEVRDRVMSKLLREPVLSAALKYDGTNVGKTSSGQVAGRNHMIAGDKYLNTSLAHAKACDTHAFRAKLSEMLDAELGEVVLYGELMCNPGYYGYKDLGLASKWICFGGVVDIPVGDKDEVAQGEHMFKISQKLDQLCLAHSHGYQSIRLLGCPAFYEFAKSSAGCSVAEDLYGGRTIADVVAMASDSIIAGEQEGIVFVVPRVGHLASVRKWKNSAEGGGVSKKHAQRLREVLGQVEAVGANEWEELRICDMLRTLIQVAEADTKPLKNRMRACDVK